MLTTSRLVSPNRSRMSQTGMSAPIAAPTWMIGLSFTPVTPKGMTACEWLWTTELTSGRFSKIAPWMKRSA